MAKLLNHFGDIKNEAKCLSALKALVPEFNRSSPSQIIASVNKRAMSKNDIRYFDFDYIELNENEAGKQIQWVNTGYFSGTQPIYAQFTGGSYNWTGALIGTEEAIRALQYQANSEPKTAVEKRKSLEKELCVNLNSLEIGEVFTDDEDSKVITRINKNEAFLNALYGKLLAPNSWTTAQLDNYINLCIVRLNHYLEKNKDYSDFIIFNEDKSLALINSGLLDKFGKYIMLALRVLPNDNNDFGGELGYTGILFADCKVSLCEKGFTKSSLAKELNRVCFYDNDISELVFNGDLEDFDLNSWGRLNHCIAERRHRFPEEYQSVPDEVIYADIVRAVEIGVALSKYDHNYIKPFYNKKFDKIEFFIPYHVGNNFQKKPELGLLITQVGEYWQIGTLLEAELVLANTKLFYMYGNESF